MLYQNHRNWVTTTGCILIFVIGMIAGVLIWEGLWGLKELIL